MRLRALLRRKSLLMLGASCLLAEAASAQGVHLRLGYGVDAVSPAEWTPAYGPSLGVEVGLLRGWRLGVDYHQASRFRDRISGYCGFATCYDGPFDEDVFLRAFGVDLGPGAVRARSLDLRAALRWRFFRQGRHLAHVNTGEEFDRSVTSDWAVGLRTEARLGRTELPVVPSVWAAYDRVLESECPADGTCYGGRNHFEVGLALLIGR